MHKVRFISDLHLGHRNMAIMRGFEDEHKMNDHIIKSWNSVVNKNDTTYVIGDLTMEKTLYYPLLNLLKGVKKVVLGNHDHHNRVLLDYVNSVWGSVKYKGFIITHIPVHPCELERFRGNIHGHVHSNSLPDKRYINVSAEAIDYIPKTLEELYESNHI